MMNANGPSNPPPPANPALQALQEKQARSVFIGNISYEANEEQLREIFERVGRVNQLKIVFDRETGKPKGYAFCEYPDSEIAQSAIRNLNGHEFCGRNLRVSSAGDHPSGKPDGDGDAGGSASSGVRRNIRPSHEPESEPTDSGGLGPDQPYGEEVDSSDAPEAITRAVASLPPEQMYELMTQMKLCLQNNPSEARQLLLQNPQLAYALLQAQIVMKIVDPQVAMAMLSRENVQPEPLKPSDGDAKKTTRTSTPPSHIQQSQSHSQYPEASVAGAHTSQHQVHPPYGSGAPGSVPTSGPPAYGLAPPSGASRPPFAGPRPPHGPPMNPYAPAPSPYGQLPPYGAHPGMPPPRPPMATPYPTPPYGAPHPQVPGQRMPPHPGYPPRPPMQPLAASAQHHPHQPTSQHTVTAGQPQPTQATASGMSSHDTSRKGRSPTPKKTPQEDKEESAQDQEKAMLIMQVLQLTDEQIAMLPPEQRQSIMVLKEQFSKSQ